jgi:hypothetical protein
MPDFFKINFPTFFLELKLISFDVILLKRVCEGFLTKKRNYHTSEKFMQYKRKSVLLMCGLIALLYVGLCVETIRAAESFVISNNDTITYETSCTAAYRMYGKTTRITVTDNTTYPMLGYLETKDGDNWVDQTASAPLIPYIVNASKWEAGIMNCPLFGVNTTQSLLIESWTEENLQFAVTGEAFGDMDRNSTVLTFSYNYTVKDRVNPTELNNVTAIWIYRWDSTLGVLLKSDLEIINHDDAALSGQIVMTLKETTLWSLPTDQIPGYPLEIIGSIFILMIGGMWIITNKRRTA